MRVIVKLGLLTLPCLYDTLEVAHDFQSPQPVRGRYTHQYETIDRQKLHRIQQHQRKILDRLPF